MSGVEIVLGVVLGLVVNEATELSPWLGRIFVRWSARLKYGGTELGAIRTEELQALINTRPGKISKLMTGLGFFSSALIFRLRRLIRPETKVTDEPAPDLSEVTGLLRLEDEPTTLIARYLFPTERYRGEWKRHWISPVKAGLVVLLYGVLGIWVVQLRVNPQYTTYLTIGIAVATVLLLAWQVPRWYFDRVSLTNKRLMLVRGILRREVEMLPLLRVTDVRYVQSPLGRLLSYGTFENDSTGRRKITLHRLRDLPNPNELYLRIVEEMYEPQAVEERLGNAEDDEQAPDPVQALTASVQELVTAVGELVGTMAAQQGAPGKESPEAP